MSTEQAHLRRAVRALQRLLVAAEQFVQAERQLHGTERVRDGEKTRRRSGDEKDEQADGDSSGGRAGSAGL